MKRKHNLNIYHSSHDLHISLIIYYSTQKTKRKVNLGTTHTMLSLYKYSKYCLYLARFLVLT